jgi:hypothetical protein
MQKKFTSILLWLLFYQLSIAQLKPIDVAETTLKIGRFGEETFFYGFAEGDKMIFSFEEVNGKELKEIEIIELPSSSRLMDYKSSRIQNKTITINRAGIYKFRFANSAISGRVCRFKIQRIPASDLTKNFNTSVSLKTVYDTTYTTQSDIYLDRSDTSVVNLVDQVPKVFGKKALNGNDNKMVLDFSLPNGTIGWSYYIGVGNEGKKAYDNGSNAFVSAGAQTVSKMPGYNSPLAALALHGTNYFLKTQGRDNVKYYFITDLDNVHLFKTNRSFKQYKQGDVINDASQMQTLRSGKIYLGLYNDNLRDPVDVIVKVTAIVVTESWKTKPVQKMNITSRRELAHND